MALGFLGGGGIRGVAQSTQPDPSAGVWIDTGSTAGGGAAFSGCRAYSTAGIAALTTATFASIPLSTEDFDTDAYHSTVTNTSRITIPSDGYYRIEGQIEFASSTASVQANIYKGGTGGTRLAADTRTNTNLTTRVQVSTGVIALVAGDYIELVAYQNSGSNLVVNGGQYATWVTINKVG